MVTFPYYKQHILVLPRDDFIIASLFFLFKCILWQNFYTILLFKINIKYLYLSLPWELKYNMLHSVLPNHNRIIHNNTESISSTLEFALSQRQEWRRQWHPTPELLPGKSHGRRSLVGCRPWGHKESDTTERLHFHFSLSCIGEGNGNPLQCSCLENPRDRGARWASIYGVAQSRTRLKRLSSSSSSRGKKILVQLFINSINVH